MGPEPLGAGGGLCGGATPICFERGQPLIVRLSLVASGEAELRPVLFRLEDRRLPLPRQVLEALGVEQRLVELTPLAVVHVRERCVAHDLLNAAA
jgi:hypothetical protein